MIWGDTGNMHRLLWHIVFAARSIALLWLDVFLLFRYWTEFHPAASECGFIGCSLNTATYLLLLAVAIAVAAGLLDLFMRRPRDLQDVMLSALYALVMLALAAGINFGAEKTPEFRTWLEALVGVQ